MISSGLLRTIGFVAILFSWDINLASAQVWPPTLQQLRGMMPGLDVKPNNNGMGWILGEWRESQLISSTNGFQLVLTWNGLDDENWPFEKIVASLAGRICGPVSPANVKSQVVSLYKTKSIIPERDLGGNGGTTFKVRLTGRLGSCAAIFFSEGARWNELGVSVVR
jgi:hypothetical protein